jgi:prepilin-type N-terminal cleavage/methylation domain-containing protein
LNRLKRSAGITLIELIVSLVISSILIAAIYRVLVFQEKVYNAQERIADMQQNLRVAAYQIVRDVRMAGCGGKNENTAGENDIIGAFGDVNGFPFIINPVNELTVDGITHDQITVVAAYDEIAKVEGNVSKGANSFSVNYVSSKRFNSDRKRYLCLNGRDLYVVVGVHEDLITLQDPVAEDYAAGEPVYLVSAVTYGLKMDPSRKVPVLFRNDNKGAGRQAVAENIENLQFRYLLSGDPGSMVDAPSNHKDIRGVEITITARPFFEGDGIRNRTCSTFVNLRNSGDP